MNIEFIKKFKSKKLICTTIGLLILILISPIVLTITKNAFPVSHALKTENTNLNNYKLNEFKNTFFDLVKLMDENTNISVERLRSAVKDLPLLKTEELDFNNIVDIYKKDNEQITVYYNKIDANEPYYAQNVEYKLNSKNPNISSIILSNLCVSLDKKMISMQVSTESINDLDKTSKVLKLDESNANTYIIYLNLLKELESNDNFTTKDLINFNPNFKKLENPYDKGRSIFEIKINGYESINVVFNENGKINTLSLSNKRNKKTVHDFIITKTKDSKDIGWDIQEHYNQEYNLTYGKTGHVISIEKENIEDTKKLFIDFLSEYN